MTKTQRYAAGGIGAAVALGLAYLATRTTGPVPLPEFTEETCGRLQPHLPAGFELSAGVAYTPHRYPPLIAPNLGMVITKGFTPLYRLPDPQVAALPAESD